MQPAQHYLAFSQPSATPPRMLLHERSTHPAISSYQGVFHGTQMFSDGKAHFGLKRVFQHFHPGNLGAGLQKLSRRLFDDQMNTLQEGRIAKLNLSELPLAAIASGILLYVTGQEQHKAETGQPYASNRWLKMLAEGGVLYGILATTQNLYPVMGGGLLAYTWGKADSVLKKINTTIDIVASLAASAIGVLFGLGVSGSAKTYDFKQLFQHLNAPNFLSQLQQIQTSLSQSQSTPSPQKMQAIKQLIQELTTKQGGIKQDHARFINTTTPLNTKERNQILRQTQQWFNQLRPLIETLEQDFAQQFGQIKKATPGNPHQFSQLIKKSTAMHVQLARAMNPIFGAIILGTLAQAFVSKPLKTLMGKLFPRLNATNMVMPEHTYLFNNAHHRTTSTITNPLYVPHYDVGSELNHHLVGGAPGHRFGWGT